MSGSRVALSQVHLRDNVPIPGGSASESTFPPGGVSGYRITWAVEEGVVILERGDHKRIVPLSNVKAMAPAMEEKPKAAEEKPK